MNDNPKNNILLSENIRQKKRLIILEYFDAYICQHYQPKMIFSDNKMLFFGLSFILYKVTILKDISILKLFRCFSQVIHTIPQHKTISFVSCFDNHIAVFSRASHYSLDKLWSRVVSEFPFQVCLRISLMKADCQVDSSKI